MFSIILVVQKNLQGDEKKAEEDSKINGTNTVPSLVALTKNLTLNSQQLKTNAWTGYKYLKEAYHKD